MWKIEEIQDFGKKISQPGWDYVVDTGYDPSKAPIQPTNKKRTARSAGDITAKQNNAILKRLAELDKDNARDVQVPIPKAKEGGRKGKTTATRKILAAQKTFANYLADEEALAAIAAQNSVQARANQHTRRSSSYRPPASTSAQETSEEVQDQNDKPIVPLRPASDGTEDSHLLQTIVPSAPSDALMEALCTAPPLSYNAARVGPSTSGKPPLHFCETCGYWGKIKCTFCGVRVCGLACKKKHDIECQKYGGR
jgi:zinc finger HIT domain-containing protein 1